MAADAANPRLDALKALLTSAQELAHALETDPTIGRVLRALASLPPEDRQILAAVLERGAAQRRINESFARMNGVRLRINPKPRLFVRVMDTEPPPAEAKLDEEDIVPDVLRLMRRASLLLAPEAQAVWHPAVEQALGMLSPKEREDCIRLAHDVLALVTAPPGDVEGS